MPRCSAPVVFLLPLAMVALNLAGAQPARPAAQPQKIRVDQHGDPLPDGAVARLGTTRFRHGGRDLLGFSSDGKSLIFADAGFLHLMDATLGKEIKVVKYGDGDAPYLRRLGMPASPAVLSADTKVLAVTVGNPGPGMGNVGAISVIDTATNKERKRFGIADLFKNGAAFGPLSLSLTDDGRWLLISDNVGRFGRAPAPPLVWIDTISGQRHEFAAEKDCRFGHAQFSRDGRLIVAQEHAVSKGTSRLRTIDVGRAAEVQSIEVPAKTAIANFALLPGAKMLLASSDQGEPVRLYDLSAGKELKEIRAFSDPSTPQSFLQSRDGKQLFIAGGGKVHQWDVASGKEIRQIDVPDARQGVGLPGFPGSTTPALAVSLDGLQLAFSGPHNVEVFDTRTGKRRAGGGGGSAVGTLRFTPDGKGLITSNVEGVVQQWDVPAAKVQRVFARFEKQASPRQNPFDLSWMFVGQAAFSADGKLLAVGMGDRGVGLWDAASGAALKWFGPDADQEKVPGAEGIPHAFAFAPSGNMLATSMPQGAIKLWDAVTRKGLRTWNWHAAAPAQPGVPDAAIFALAFSPDGKTLAGAGFFDMGLGMPGSAIILWETASGKERLRLSGAIKGFDNNEFQLEAIFAVLDQMGLSLAFSPDGKHLMIGTFKSFHLVDSHTGKDVVSYTGHMILGRTATFSADGKLLFIGRADGSLRILDAATGRVMRDVPAHTESLLALALAPGGKLLASGSSDSTVLLWDVAELCQPPVAGKTVLSPQEMEELWKDLAGDDAAKAYQSMNALAAAPADAVQFLKSHLQPIEPVDPQLLAKLLNGLNSQKFSEREKVTAQLEKLGDLAGPILRERLVAHPTLEMRQRIEKLVTKLNAAVQSPATLQALRSIEVLERIGNREALNALTPLAKGAAGHRITEDARDAVQRLQRQIKAP